MFRLHVVDADRRSYVEALRALRDADISVAFYGCASAALRDARRRPRGVWFVSLRLPDLPGPQLIEMLVEAPGHKLVVAMGDRYSRDEETAARASGACQYFVKPLADQLWRAVVEAYAPGTLSDGCTARNRAQLS